MQSAFFVLLRLICYPALAVMLAAGAALAIVWVNGQCPPFDEVGVTCATKFSQRLADFGLSIAVFSALTGIPAIPGARRRDLPGVRSAPKAPPARPKRALAQGLFDREQIAPG